MGAPAPTAPTIQQARQFQQYEEANMQQPWQNPTRSGYDKPDDPVNQDRFPAVYFPKDPYDTVWETKNQIITGGGMYGKSQVKQGAVGVGEYGPVVQTVPITDRDVEYSLDKARREEYANFLQYAEQLWDLSDPAQVRLFEAAFPGYYERRKALITNLGANQTKFAMLRLLGPRTAEDAMFQWLVQTGKVPLINGPLWDPKSWADQGPKKQYALLNPWRLLTATNAPNMPNLRNRTDPVGDPTRALNVAPYNEGLWNGKWPMWSGAAGYRQMQTGSQQEVYSGAGGPHLLGRTGNPLAGPFVGLGR
jgi:hypothetical protein